MRIATIIVATLMLLGTTALGLLGSNRSIQDAKAIDEIYSSSRGAIDSAAAAGSLEALRSDKKQRVCGRRPLRSDQKAASVRPEAATERSRVELASNPDP